MKQKKSYMRFIMEDADDAHLLYFGFPNRIQTYSTVRKWFVKVTEKALLLFHFLLPLSSSCLSSSLRTGLSAKRLPVASCRSWF